MSIEPHVIECVGKKNVHDFSTWAFGDGYKKLNGETLVSEWNTRHGDKYYVSLEVQNDVILERMKAIWLDTVGKDSKEKPKK